MTTFTIIMEMIPGREQTRVVDQIDAENMEHAWSVARAKWYNSPLEEQNRVTIDIPAGEVMEHKSVTPQIVDIKEGEYELPVLASTEPVPEAAPAHEPAQEEPALQPAQEEPAHESAPVPEEPAPTPQPEAATNAEAATSA